jgi:GntR family transcriptional regulator
MLKTSPFSTRPLYLQVRDLLVARIVAGEWKPGGTLPNEVDLARELSVSPGTVRRALEEMESERLIYRRQGRGTFVADHTSEELAIRYTNIRTSKGVRLAGEIGGAELSTGEAHELEQKRLRLRPGSRVTRIQRIRQSGNVPFMVECVVLPHHLFPGLSDLREVPHRITLLAQQFNLLLGRAEEQVRADVADDRIAKALQIATDTPILSLDRVVYTLDGRPVEWRLAKCHLGNEVYWTEMT